MCGRFCSLPFVQVYQCVNVGPRGATRHTACPVLLYSESGPLGLSVHECGAAGSSSGQTACPVCPTLHQSRSHHGHASPLHPGAHLCPSYQSGCMFLFCLLGVRLPCRSIFVSSGCARRCSVATYTDILVLPHHFYLKKNVNLIPKALAASQRSLGHDFSFQCSCLQCSTTSSLHGRLLGREKRAMLQGLY